MHPLRQGPLWAASLLAAAAALVAAACASGPPEPSYADALAYCAAVGDIDAPDARYTGPDVPSEVLKTLRLRRYAPDAHRIVWRCMGGSVYACSPAKQISCMDKADVGRTPTEASVEYCRQNPSAALIPASATGYATVHTWECENGAPQIFLTSDEPDARGFRSGAWTQVRGE